MGGAVVPLAFLSSPRQTGVGLALGGVTLWRRRERPVTHR
jgi:hypothetical protein